MANAPGYLADYLNNVAADERIDTMVSLGKYSYPNAENYSTSDCLSHIRMMKARIGLGKGRGKILCMGDSTTEAATRAISYPNKMADRLTKLGIPATAESVCGEQNNSSGYAGYFPAVNMGTWGFDASRISLGRAPFRLDAATGDWTFTPLSGKVDTFVIKYLAGPAFGTCSLFIDNAAPTTGPASVAAANATLGFAYATVKAAAVGAHALKISKTTAAPFFIYEVLAYDSTVPAIDIINAGWATSRTTDWNVTGQPFNPAAAIVAGGYDATIIGLSINDRDNGLSAATTLANLAPLVAAARTNGDCIIVVPAQTNPARNSYADPANQALTNQVLSDLAISTGSLLVNLQSRMGTFAQANAAGFMADDIHFVDYGYFDWGNMMADIIAQA